MKRHHPLFIVAFTLLLATLACSLTREEIVPTAAPTVDLTATFEAARGSGAQEDVIVPVVEVLEIQPASPIVLGSTVLISVNATHETAVETLLLEIARVDNLPGGQQPGFETASRIDVESETTDVSDQLRWQPFDAGSYQLIIFAVSGNNLGESVTIPIDIVEPEVASAPDGDNGAGGATDPGPCLITPLDGNVTIRSDSSDQSSNRGTLSAGQSATATATGRDASWQGWYLISSGGTTGWVKGTQVGSEGGCTPNVHLPLQE